uniref:Uncharacterized protein n=1 Tax=Corethron hystrix TaxID=216773 RepID=A0A7S1BQA9_9STRA|mmetsp:Transcript_37011/g.86388  ORF Transcript_37011/g.86388 Transcript_37011/m.86388 type:complete len:320 (+) Transcript_37011:30-989(+)
MCNYNGQNKGLKGDAVMTCLIGNSSLINIGLENEKCSLHKQASNSTCQILSSMPSGRSRSYWVPIPANHPLKIVWDTLTILLSISVGVYTTHASMRDLCFPHLLNNSCVVGRDSLPLFFGYFSGSTVVTLMDLWCVADIVLNFLTVNENSYLMTWFFVDVISMLSWEVIYVQPIFNAIRRERILSKAVGFTRKFPLFKRRWSQLVRLSFLAKAVGSGPTRLIRFAPKYFVFAGKMKVVIGFRMLRYVRLVKRLLKNLKTAGENDRQSLVLALRASEEERMELQRMLLNMDSSVATNKLCHDKRFPLRNKDVVTANLWYK